MHKNWGATHFQACISQTSIFPDITNIAPAQLCTVPHSHFAAAYGKPKHGQTRSHKDRPKSTDRVAEHIQQVGKDADDHAAFVPPTRQLGIETHINRCDADGGKRKPVGGHKDAPVMHPSPA